MTVSTTLPADSPDQAFVDAEAELRGRLVVMGVRADHISVMYVPQEDGSWVMTAWDNGGEIF